MKLSEVKQALKAHIVVGDDKLDIQVTAGVASDLMSDLLRVPRTNDLVILSGLYNIQVIRTSVITGASAMVFVRGKLPDRDMISYAREHELPLLSTPFTMYTACGRLFGLGLRGVEQKI
jgi:predicted transcriptional regulator